MARKHKNTQDFIKEVFEMVGDEYTVESEYMGCFEPILMKHNNITCVRYGEAYQTTPREFKKHGRCKYCYGRYPIPGKTDLISMLPELAEKLVNPSDGFLHWKSGSPPVEWRCSDCNNIFPRTIYDIIRRGFTCPYCGDGISYPNKFMYNILKQCKSITELKREYSPCWCKFEIAGKKTSGKYDIYFVINNREIIIEMDGGLGHGNRNIGGIDIEENISRDSEKDRLAFEKNIEVVRIDCDYGNANRFEFIVENIKKSKLQRYIDFKKIDLKLADKEALNSLVFQAGELWEKGLKACEISEYLGITADTVGRYLKQCATIGKCDYSKEKSKLRGSAHSVYCLTTEEKFNSITAASDAYGISESVISKCCRKIACSGGEYKGQQLQWVYYSDYLKFINGELKSLDIKENNNFTQVFCITTNRQFSSIKEAASEYGIRPSGIQAACCGRYKYSGIHPDNGEKLYWRYVNNN